MLGIGVMVWCCTYSRSLTVNGRFAAKQFTKKAQTASPKNSNTRSCVIVKIYFGQTHPYFFLKTGLFFV
jgi:hypothetical protein